MVAVGTCDGSRRRMAAIQWKCCRVSEIRSPAWAASGVTRTAVCRREELCIVDRIGRTGIIRIVTTQTDPRCPASLTAGVTLITSSRCRGRVITCQCKDAMVHCNRRPIRPAIRMAGGTLCRREIHRIVNRVSCAVVLRLVTGYTRSRKSGVVVIHMALIASQRAVPVSKWKYSLMPE